MALNKNDYLIIIRAAGERTEELCIKRAKEQGFPENVVIVKEVPFHRSLVNGFEIAMEYNHRWTICVDADVLLVPCVIEKIVEILNHSADDIFRFNPMVISKFHQIKMFGGVHCYRTSLLKNSRHFFSEAEFNMKPETFVNKKMFQQGFGYQKIKIIAGFHEYELSFNDIYRRYRYRASKSSNDEYNLLKKIAKINKKNELDYKVVLRAMIDGRLIPIRKHSIDAISDSEIKKVIAELHLEEKSALNEIDLKYLVELKNNFTTPEMSKGFEDFLSQTVGDANPINLGKHRYTARFERFERLKLHIQRALL